MLGLESGGGADGVPRTIRSDGQDGGRRTRKNHTWGVGEGKERKRGAAVGSKGVKRARERESERKAREREKGERERAHARARESVCVCARDLMQTGNGKRHGHV